jgi:hypothetical protein
MLLYQLIFISTPWYLDYVIRLDISCNLVLLNMSGLLTPRQGYQRFLYMCSRRGAFASGPQLP